MRTFETWEQELCADFKAGMSFDALVFKYQYKIGQYKHAYTKEMAESIVRDWMIQYPRVGEIPEVGITDPRGVYGK